MSNVKVITCSAGNGGSACSTTATNLAYWLSKTWGAYGRVLLADFDRQGDSGKLMGVPNSPNATRFLQRLAAAQKAIVGTEFTGLDFIPSNGTIPSVETMISQQIVSAENADEKNEIREIYSDLIRDLTETHIAVVIDPPKTGEIQLLSIRSSDKLVIPTKLSYHNRTNVLSLVKLAHGIMLEHASISILPVALEPEQKKENEELMNELLDACLEICNWRKVSMGDGIPASVVVRKAAEAGQPVLQFAPADATTVRGKRQAAVSKAYEKFFNETFGV